MAPRRFATNCGDYRFAHVPLAIAGLMLLRQHCAGDGQPGVNALNLRRFDLSPGLLPPLLIGGRPLTLVALALAWQKSDLGRLTAGLITLLRSA
jgi:hypothetical protein